MTTTLTPVFGDRTREGSAAFTMRHPPKELAQTLGYDPQPAVRTFRGNWLPPCYYPLPMTEISARIALRVWWNGPAWTILRNSSFFLWRVWDYGAPEHMDYALGELPREPWLRAIDDAVPGEVSRGATTLWALRFDKIEPLEYIDWPDAAHLRDYRPMAKLTKAQFLDRVRYCNAQSQASPHA